MRLTYLKDIFHPPQRFLEIGPAGGIRYPAMLPSALSKSRSWNGDDPCSCQLAGHQVAVSHPREEIESAIRLCQVHSHLPEACYQKVSAAHKLIPHLTNAILGSTDRLQGCGLGDGAGAGLDILMNLEMLLYSLVPGGEITQPPAGHGIGLGDGIDGDHII